MELGDFEMEVRLHEQAQTQLHHRLATEMDRGWMDREVGDAVEKGAQEIVDALNGEARRPNDDDDESNCSSRSFAYF